MAAASQVAVSKILLDAAVLKAHSGAQGLSSGSVRTGANAAQYSTNLRLRSKKAISGFRRSSKLCVRAAVEETTTSVENAASAAGDSVVPEVAGLPEAGDTEGVASKRKPSPLERGGTLRGEKAEGKDPGAAALGKASKFAADGEKFADPRWKNGTWDVAQFTSDGKVNWDAVIDAEVVRRKWLEENPESSTNEDPVVFDTSQVPWWAWVRRFHLPEAEKLNGRAAMVGYALGYLVDAATGVGLVDQSNSFLGKLLILVTIAGVLLVRENRDLANLKNLADEWTFYDKQWQATWKEGPPRPGTETPESKEKELK